MSGMLEVVHAQCQVDGRVIVAELPEAQRQIEDTDGPEPSEQGIECAENEGDDTRDRNQRNHNGTPGPGAVMALTGIETLLDPLGQPRQGRTHTGGMRQGAQLFEEQNGDHGENDHGDMQDRLEAARRTAGRIKIT